MSDAPHDLLTHLLRGVSRSFYLTLRVLPLAVRPQIGLAYLLARATDTIADTELVAPEERLRALDQLRGRVLGTNPMPVDFITLANRQSSTAEQVLLARVEEAVAVLSKMSYSDQQRIREVLTTITSGQELDLRRFAGAGGKRIVGLSSELELDDYTYRVAGCVGEFWTKMCRGHLFPNAPLDEARLLADGIRFGKGLQLVNILRDLPKDLRQGRCYLPTDQLKAAGLQPEDLLEVTAMPHFVPVYHHYLGLAEAHLQAGWRYTNALPRWGLRLRLACALPILIGLETLGHLRASNVLDSRRRVKVTRREVRFLIARLLFASFCPPAWRRLVPARRSAETP